MKIRTISWGEAEDGDDFSYVVQAFGRNSHGQSVCVDITGFLPYFYLRVPAKATATIVKLALEKRLWNRDLRDDPEAQAVWKKKAIHSVVIEQKQDFVAGFRGQETVTLAKVLLRSWDAARSIENAIVWGPKRNMSLVIAGATLSQEDIFETNVIPKLRFFHETKVMPSGVLEVPDECLLPLPVHGNTNTDKYYQAHVKDVRPCTDPINIPLRLCCWDLECYSATGKFPQAANGDPIIQAGFITAMTDGSGLRRDILVLGSCNRWPEADETVKVQTFATERELLLGFQKIIIELDPDTLVDYNGWGFDHKYLLDRAMANGVELSLGRTSDVTEINNLRLEVASGVYQLNYLEMFGRMQVDMLVLLRREHNLSSYKLDDVSSHFMRGIVNGLSVEDRTNVSAKGINGIKPGDHVRFEHQLDTSTPLWEGRKFIVKDISKDGLVLHEPLPLDMPDHNVMWCLSKDDLPAREIFRCHRGGPDDRGRIAKYCLMDCELTLQLFNKLSILVNLSGMANVCSVPMDFLMVRGQGIKTLSLVARECAQRNQVIRKKFIDRDYDPNSDDGPGYEGAIVLDPDVDMYLEEPVAVGDFNSLYPNSIISHNISHETLVWSKDFDIDDKLLSMTGDVSFEALPGVSYIDIRYDIKAMVGKTNKKVGYTVCRYVQSETVVGTLPLIEMMLLGQRKAVRAQIPLTEDSFQKDILEGMQLAYKITANSLYGQLGSRVGPVGKTCLAASITAVGRENILKAKDYVESHYDAKVIYGDSVTGDTALVLEVDGALTTRRIDELATGCAWQPYGEGKEAIELPESIKVWTEAGFTHIKRVIRHACKKRMFRILTHCGVADVTEDHSLLDEQANKVRPVDVQVGSKLLHSSDLPTPSITADSVTPDEAWAMGYEVGAGYYGVPNEILNGSIELVQAFWHGFTVFPSRPHSKEICTGMSLLAERLGRVLAINEDFTVSLAADNKLNTSIKRITELPDFDGYVYDLETSSHHFHVGPGRLVVHNTDSIFIKFKLDTALTDREKVQKAIELGKDATAAISKIVRQPHKIAYEKTFFPFILIRRKGYVGLKYEEDPDHCKKSSMGIVLKRRDNADIVKDIYGGAIDILLKEKDERKAQQWVVTELGKLIAGKVPLDKLVITKSLRDDYAKPETVSHWCLAERMRQRDPGSAPVPGDRIPYIIIKRPGTTKISDCLEHVDYVRSHPAECKPDAKYYLENQLENPLAQLFGLCIERLSGFTKPKDYYRKLRKNLEAAGDMTEEQVERAIEKDKNAELQRILFIPDRTVRRIDSFWPKK